MYSSTHSTQTTALGGSPILLIPPARARTTGITPSQLFVQKRGHWTKRIAEFYSSPAVNSNTYYTSAWTSGGSAATALRRLVPPNVHIKPSHTTGSLHSQNAASRYNTTQYAAWLPSIPNIIIHTDVTVKPTTALRPDRVTKDLPPKETGARGSQCDKPTSTASKPRAPNQYSAIPEVIIPM